MGGCCCRLSGRTELHRSPLYHYCPVVENESLTSSHDRPPAVSVLLIDPIPDSTIPASFQEPITLPPLENFVRTQPSADKNELRRPTASEPRDDFEGSDSCDGLEESEFESASDFLCDSSKLKEKFSDLDNSMILVTDEEDVCPICLEGYDAENPQIFTKCKHHFHLSCILDWFERSNTCAICDKIMEVENMALFDQSL